MALFSVYLPHAEDGPRSYRLENARFVRDGFSWGAFFVPVIWLVWHRTWRWVLLVMAFELALMVLGARLGLTPATLALLSLLQMLFVGLEARKWYGLALERRGFELADIVQAGSLEDAERRFYERVSVETSVPSTVVMPPSPPRYSGVIGLFPEQGTRG